MSISRSNSLIGLSQAPESEIQVQSLSSSEDSDIFFSVSENDIDESLDNETQTKPDESPVSTKPEILDTMRKLKARKRTKTGCLSECSTEFI